MNLLSNLIKNRLPLFGVIYLSWLLLPVELQSDVDHECLSLDIRNECQNFAKLRNCSVITGYLIIVLLPLQNSGESCDLEHYRFPLLREITDFLIFYEVRNMTSLRKMFPNLTVIRGQQLFLNYALGITYMNDLQTVRPTFSFFYYLLINNEFVINAAGIRFSDCHPTRPYYYWQQSQAVSPGSGNLTSSL